MNIIQALSFTTPLALGALLLLPVIWWLLRFTPPKPETVRFPPIRLLLDLVSREEQPDKTPWWLLLLRLAVAALLILAVSHPLYAPGRVATIAGTPLLLVIDDTWAAAKDWNKRQEIISEILEGGKSADATVVLATTAPQTRPQPLEAASADDVQKRASALQPRAIDPARSETLAVLQKQFATVPALRVIWISDGIDDGKAADFTAGLVKLANGTASVEAIIPETSSLPLALAAPGFDGGRIKVTALRASTGPASTRVAARAANGRSFGDVELKFAANATRAEGTIELPVELRNEVGRIEIADEHNAAATFLMDDRWRRKTVGLLTGASSESAQPLLSPLYYVSRALEPFSELSQPVDTPSLKSLLDQGLSMLVLADVGVLPQEQQDMVTQWVERGGVLLRFAGPRLAGTQDSLIPVTIRDGGRALGSALSWETPQGLQAFPDASPFTGLAVDPQVKVTRQVLAEPDSELPAKVWAGLEDGTPLVTAKREGKGLLVLYHVTANADWSNLPLSGLFVQMLRRVLDLAPAAGGGATATDAARQADAQAFVPWRELNGFGELADPSPDVQPIPAGAIDKAATSAATPAGLYRRGEQERALNISRGGDSLKPILTLPPGIAIRSLVPLPALQLAPYAFAAATVLFLLDCLAALFLGGGINRLRARRAGLAAFLLLAILPWHGNANAQSADEFAMQGALQTRFAYVITGDSSIDQISEQGLKGLIQVLRDRTSVDAGDPVGVNIERDDVVFFPIIYWPVRAEAAVPSDAALARMDAYMRNGGTIFFDLREDGNGADALSGGATASSDALRRMLAKLDIPPLEPVPDDHVLTRSFYLLDHFPGRYDGGRLWVERSDSEGAASGNSDGVSGIIIGSNDYAAAWALDDMGDPVFASVPGTDRQREFAFRTGINIIMYALTGNYKADQVHIPALLERLGQ